MNCQEWSHAGHLPGTPAGGTSFTRHLHTFKISSPPPKKGGNALQEAAVSPSPLLTAVGCLSPLPFPCLSILMPRFHLLRFLFSHLPSFLPSFPPSLSVSPLPSLSLPLRHRRNSYLLCGHDKRHKAGDGFLRFSVD